MTLELRAPRGATLSTGPARWPLRSRLGRLFRVADSMGQVFLALFSVTAGIAVMVVLAPRHVPMHVFIPVMVLGAVLLTPRRLGVLLFVVSAAVCVNALTNRRGEQFLIEVLAIFLTMGVLLLVSGSRNRTRQVSLPGDSMLFDLRDRLARAGEITRVPQGWRVESALRSANGDAFSGDFLVTATTECGERLEVALVDVSGKGHEAGTHALMLSGAMAGLLGSLPAREFLAAANRYLLRQQWDERFATVVHLALDYTTGQYTLSRAGHPPAAHYRSGTGTWHLLTDGRGPLLGVLRDVTYPRVSGQLDPGDALLLYSDGVIESRGRNLEDGIDRMLGTATRAMVAGGGRVASDVCEAARSGALDDRAAFAIIRD